MVRVHLNAEEGVNWWAEDDLGFTGGADRLADLVGTIEEWAKSEGISPEDLAIRLVSSDTPSAKGLTLP